MAQGGEGDILSLFIQIMTNEKRDRWLAEGVKVKPGFNSENRKAAKHQPTWTGDYSFKYSRKLKRKNSNK